ncbi:MAG: hypothetical protein RLZZ281_271 [Pseudomonadota bacterium]|jgi:hypothetical protein
MFALRPQALLTHGGLFLSGVLLALSAVAQQAPSMLPPQVVTSDPSLSSGAADAEEEAAVTITPDDRSTSIRTYGSGGRPTREVVDPPLLPQYSESPPAEPQSVIPDSDPVRGDMVQPPMWTLWSW